MKKTIAAALFTLVFATSLFSDEIKLITLLDIDARLAYSSVSGSDSSWSGSANLFALPALKLGQSDYILPVINSSFSTSEKVIEEETLFLQRWNNMFSLAWKHKLNEGLDFKVSGDARYNFNIETKDESLGHGLYDLYDLGAAASVTVNQVIEDKPYPVTFMAKYYSRKYPNYTSLAASGTSGSTVTIDKELKPKDFNAVNLSAGWKNKMGGIFTDLSYNLVYKSYLDAYARTFNGTFSDTKRSDAAHYFDFGFMSYLNNSQTLGLDANYSIYTSTGNVFDTSALVFQDNYYGYTSVSVRPNTYFLLGEITIGIYYQYLVRTYAARTARGALGNYTDLFTGNVLDHEIDIEQTLGASFKYPLSKSLSAVAGLNYFTTSSNMKYEAYVRYSYSIINFSAGLSYSL
ncbi:MAG: hypothetical protein WCI43_00990 [Candidatus Firestonebacteria bacterium]